MAGVRGDGSALAVSPDDNIDSLISAAEAYDYALSIDDPVMDESPVGASDSLWLSRCRTDLKIKEVKEFKEFKEIKEFEPKQYEPKQYEPKAFEPKGFDPKGYEPKGFEAGGIEAGPSPVPEELETRLVRLERAVSRLAPFIQGELRPNVYGGLKSKEEDTE